MGFLFGLVIAVGSLFAAALHLNQEAKHFWDFVAFACVHVDDHSPAVDICDSQVREFGQSESR